MPPSNASTIKVTVANGVYEEMLSNVNKSSLVINGESRDNTIIQFENYDTFLPGVGGFADASTAVTSYTTPNGDMITVPIGGTSKLYEGGRSLYELAASNTEINNITIKNTHVKVSSLNNAAETLYFNASGKFISRDTNWISSQDTLQVKGDTWFYNCLVAGDLDFIWGSPLVGLFENCEIRTRVDPTAANGPSYAVQSRGVSPNPGFIFLNSRFTAESGVPAGSGYLARSQSTTGTPLYDPIVFTSCVVGPHIKAAGFYGTSATTSPTDVTGLRYYNLTDTNNAAWVPSGSTTPFFALTPAQNAALYPDRAKIYSATSVSDGGSPANTYTSIAWTLSTTY